MRTVYGAKYPKRSRIRCVELEPKALTDPLVVGMIAIFDVMAPSCAFSVETSGRSGPCGQRVRKPSWPGGTTVALKISAWAVEGASQPLVMAFTSRTPLNGGEPAGLRVSMTRQGDTLYNDNPPGADGAKYPLMSITRSEASVANTLMAPPVPAGTMAALAVVAPVGALSVETSG